MTKAEEYRKRAGTIGQGVRRRSAREGRLMLKKQKALSDMADNEDWLDGKIKTMAKA
jgi:hypothetical protein